MRLSQRAFGRRGTRPAAALFATGLILLSVLLASPAAAAGQVSQQRFASETLQRDYPYTLYLPEGYAVSHQAYPVIYLLHGSFGSETDWVQGGRLRQTADRLIRLGVIPPVVIVMPGAESWWIDGHNEAARTAFFEDLVPHIEESWHVVPEREWRGVAGLSAGGFGALNFALERPEMFAAVAAFSPASYHPLPPDNSSAWRHPSFQRDGSFDAELWERSNYTAHLDDYLAQELTVPVYLTAGDRDRLNAVHHARLVQHALEPRQPGDVRLDVLPGGHTWRVWRASLPRGLSFMARHLQAPVPLESDDAPVPAPAPDR
ncbi:enterochelin esterase-like enzyme [Halomonas campaniensis]|uniref:Enterochelin esterase-like enzyme n=1 Tax=Halomonas campaniensis TaxID=213554 RepID=A0A7W5K5I3_9GAMM|nr:alpha/beta hydrolase-fold protein [Halomonas campaniensis]MBB3332289.1 enterochelin esterase-like enzyme [Halomonas campaniensis]